MVTHLTAAGWRLYLAKPPLGTAPVAAPNDCLMAASVSSPVPATGGSRCRAVSHDTSRAHDELVLRIGTGVHGLLGSPSNAFTTMYGEQGASWAQATPDAFDFPESCG